MSILHLSFPPTVARVERNTSKRVNSRIEQHTIDSIARTLAGGPAAISERLRELDREWDIERILETNASIATLAGLGLGRFVNEKWYGLPAAVAAFLLLHALQGWCPPVPILRRMGFRSEREIHIERTALRIARGDFERPTLGLATLVKQASGEDFPGLDLSQ